MLRIQSKETPETAVFRPVERPEFERWIAAGVTEQTELVYGASIPVVLEILRNGYLPAVTEVTPNLLPYQNELLKSYRRIHYAFPVTLNGMNEGALLLSIMLYKSGLSDSYSPKEYSNRLINGANAMAARMAIRHEFGLLTGMTPSDTDIVVSLSEKYARKAYKDFIEKFPEFGGIGSPEDAHTIARYENALKGLDKAAILSQCLSKRGALLCFGRDIFFYDMSFGVEDDFEIMVHSISPIPATVICGIVPGTDAELAQLLEAYKE